jgi:hypothetical protein
MLRKNRQDLAPLQRQSGLLSGAASFAEENPVEAGLLATSMAPVPVVSDVAGLLGDALGMYKRPEDRTWGNAGLAALGLLPWVPALGLAKKARDSLLNSRGSGYNTPPVGAGPAPSFAKEYPNGARTDGSGNLLFDIEGREIVAPASRIVGRRSAGGPNEPLSPEELDPIAKAGTGRDTEILPQSEIGPGVLGSVMVNRRGGLEGVRLSKAIKPEEFNRVYGHEIGHVVDQIAKEIPPPRDALKLYDQLNHPTLKPGQQRYNKLLEGPSARLYPTKKLRDRELMAETIRAYIESPEWIKAEYPVLAEKIRKAVNKHKALNKIIHLNSFTPVAGLLSAGVLADAAIEDTQTTP